MAQGNVNVTYLDLGKIVSETRTTINFMRDRKLLHREFYCCNTQSSLVNDVYGSKDGQIFQCNVCLKCHSIRKNSFFLSQNYHCKYY